MRIRTQLVGALAAAALTTALVGSVLVYVTRHAAQGALAQAETQNVARDITSLVTLSLEITSFDSERAASQLRSRYAQLSATLEAAAQQNDSPLASLAELRRNVEQLPELFELLDGLPSDGANDADLRRKQFLVERLVSELHEVVEARHRWAQDIGSTQAADQRIFTSLVLGAPLALVLLIVALALVIAVRVLRPLAHLQASVTAIRDGHLEERCDTGRRDELGDAARAVDSMTTALQRSNESLSREMAGRRDTETRLHLVTDNVPALVSYLDRDQRFLFANRAYREWLHVEPDSMTGRSLLEFYGEVAYARMRPHIEAALAGEAVTYDREFTTPEGVRHVQVAISPQQDAEGKVQGLFVLIYDITARRLVEIERAARHSQVEASLLEKEVLLKEIHHRVKNNMQVISSLLQLQARFIEDDGVRRIFEESQGRIKSMALVHEQLYQSKDLARIDFGEYVRELVSGLSGSHGAHAARVRIEVVAEPVPLDVDRAVPAGLIVNELVTNSFKHAFPERRAGVIRVELSGGGEAPVQLTVRDDGVGWPPGFDPARSTSLGLQLVHILARQLQARLLLESGDGVRCTLTLEAGPAMATTPTPIPIPTTAMATAA